MYALGKVTRWSKKRKKGLTRSHACKVIINSHWQQINGLQAEQLQQHPHTLPVATYAHTHNFICCCILQKISVSFNELFSTFYVLFRLWLPRIILFHSPLPAFTHSLSTRPPTPFYIFSHPAMRFLHCCCKFTTAICCLLTFIYLHLYLFHVHICTLLCFNFSIRISSVRIK